MVSFVTGMWMSSIIRVHKKARTEIKLHTHSTHSNNTNYSPTNERGRREIIQSMGVDVVDGYFCYSNGMHHTDDSNSSISNKLVHIRSSAIQCCMFTFTLD